MCSGVAECPDASDEVNCSKFKSIENPSESTRWMGAKQRKKNSFFPLALSLCRFRSPANAPICTPKIQFIYSGLFVKLSSAAPIRRCDRATEFDCGGGMCIPNTKVCDQKVDCPLGNDEPKDKCSVNECKIKNGGCDHKCVDTPAGFYCECRSGWVFVQTNSLVSLLLLLLFLLFFTVGILLDLVFLPLVLSAPSKLKTCERNAMCKGKLFTFIHTHTHSGGVQKGMGAASWIQSIPLFHSSFDHFLAFTATNSKATPHALTLMNAKLPEHARNSVPMKLVHIR